MTWFGNFYRSAIGKKAVMAITGVILFGWIFAHMAGNLKLFFGAEALNHYAEWLRDLGGPIFPHESVLWITRILLLVVVVLHIHSAYMLTMMNRRARPTDYADRDFVKGTYAARTMRWGGVIILLFVIYHLLHLTTGDAHHAFIPGEVYHNVVTGFQVWWVAAIYIIANLALGLHLYHGVWSMFSSVGMTNPRFEHWRRTFATVFAIVITAANISFPLSVLTGFVR
ncbi:MAG: succinate dehydrogenase cytochrome b subunit [Acidobacteriota bacterium]|nr:succinate dehydrogenase cytochrome b subunit [Acidobacteriota bacterium]